MKKCMGGGATLNKKAFTLIELLAVIVILAIIALIATPIVLNIIKDTKEKSLKRSAENYVKAVEQAIVREDLTREYNPDYCEIEENVLICYKDLNEQETLGELKVEIDGQIPKYVYITFENNKMKTVSLLFGKQKIKYIDNEYVLTDKEMYTGEDSILLREVKIGTLTDFKIYGNSVSILPKEYQEVEYIESTGTQYIDTDFIPTNNTRVVLHKHSTFTSTKYPVIFGVNFGSKDGGNAFQVYQSVGNLSMGRADVGSWVNAISFNNNVLIEDKIIKIELSSNGFFVDDVKIGEFSRNITQPISGSIYIFCQHGGSQATFFPDLKIYDFKIYENGKIIRNFVPCYRKSDNVIGMYDMVEDKFYTNPGTGEFLKGNDISNFESLGEEEKIVLKNNEENIEINLAGHEPLRKVKNIADYLDFKNNRIVRNIGKIDSYNNEEIHTDYISNTGDLSIGSTIYYILTKPTYEEIVLPKIEIINSNTEITVEGASKLEAQY